MLEKIIRIPGKMRFDQLDISEISLLIDADSSLSKNGNRFFSPCALDEFLNSANLGGREDLENIRAYIAANIYLNKDGDIDVEFLQNYSNELKMRHGNTED